MKALLDFFHSQIVDPELFPDALILINGGAFSAFENHPLLGKFRQVVCVDANPVSVQGNTESAALLRHASVHAALGEEAGSCTFFSYNFPRFDGFSSLETLRSRWPDQCGEQVQLIQQTRVDVLSLKGFIEAHMPGAKRIALLYNAAYDAEVAQALLRQAAQLPVQVVGALFNRGVGFAVDEPQSMWSTVQHAQGLSRDLCVLAVAKIDVCPPAMPEPSSRELELEGLLSAAQGELKGRAEQLENLLADNARLLADREQLRKEVNELWTQIEALSKASEKSSAEWDAKRKAEQADWQARLNDAQAEKTEILKRVTALESDLQTSRAELAICQTERDEAIKRVEHHMHDAEKRLSENEAKWNAEKSALQADSAKAVADCDARLKKETQSAAAATQQKESLEKDLKKARDELAMARQENAALKQQSQELEARQQLMNEELVKAEGQIELIKDLLLRERDVL